MRKFSALAASSLFLFACGRSGSPSTPDKTVTSISLSPATFALAIGGTQGLSVSAVFSDNSTAVITTASFTSSAPAVATVSDTGLVTGVTAGSAVITARQGTVSATANVTVNAAGPVTSLVVFDDNYGSGVSFAPFSGANPAIDSTQHTVGNASLKIVDPAAGSFTGGAFKLSPSVDASGFNAITFWAMASANHNIDKFGFGNDTSDTSLEVDWAAVPLTTTWTRYTLPIPNAAKLTALTGAFLFATDGGGNFTFWLDQIQYENVTLPTPTAVLPNQTLSKGVGDKVTLSGLTATWQINSAAETLSVAPKYFTFTSSNTAVATVDQNGVITCVGNGSTTITASLGAVSATGSVIITVAAGNAPTTAAPTPTQDPGTVISLFSDAYTNVFVNDWNDFGNGPTETDTQIAGNNVKEYGNLTFAGVNISNNVPAKAIDATAMTFFHVDYWTPDATTFGVKLVDFGANGTFDGPPTDPAAELDFTPVKGQWNSLELPLSQFAAGGLTTRAHIAQVIFVGSTTAAGSTVYIDNVYFHSGAAGTGSPGLTSFTVFGDNYPTGVSGFTAFGGNPVNDINVDNTVAHSGTSSLKVIIPQAPGFTGGSIVLPSTVNLSGTNALTFWAKASSAKTIDNAGIVNDANGDNTFQVQLNSIALTTDWQQFIIPLPDASVLTAVKGVFYFATASDPNGIIFWIDDIQYGVLGGAVLGTGQPDITTATVTHSVGESFAVPQPKDSWFLNGSATATSFDISPHYFSFTSSDPTVASVDLSGTVQALKIGTANITATVNGVPAAGEITVNVAAQAVPAVAPPRPTAAAATVISLLSDAYTSVPVDHFKASFDTSTVTDVTVGADHVKKYTGLGFCAIETDSAPSVEIDATAMNFVHVDIWTPNAGVFKFKLVDFGANGTFQGGDDSEAELTFNATSTPALVSSQWVSLDIPLSTFLTNGLAAKKHLSQYIFSTSQSDGVVYVDNLYFHQ